MNDFDRLLANEYLDWYMKDELLDETELYPFAEDEKGVSFLVSWSLRQGPPSGSDQLGCNFCGTVELCVTQAET